MKSTVFVLEDTTESRHFDLLKLCMCNLVPMSSSLALRSTVLEQTHPDVALISSRADEGAIEVLREFSQFSCLLIFS